MRCPRCGFEQAEDVECARCGVVFAKWAERQRRARAAEVRDPAPAAPDSVASTPPDPGPSTPPRRPLLGASPSAVRDACLGASRMLRSGIGAQEALHTLAGGAGGAVQGALSDLAARLDAGETLADAMAWHPGVFSPADVQVVRAGERIGQTARALEHIADRLDGRLALRRQLWRSATYPLIVLAASIVLTPIPELVLGSAGSYLSGVLWNLALVAGAVAFVALGLPRLLAASTAAGRGVRRLAWRLPWPATVYRHGVRATFSRVLARNLDAGLSIFESLGSAAAVTGDGATVEAAQAAGRRVEGGERLADALGAEGLIPSADRMVLLSGERAGTLVESLESLGAAYADRRARGLRAVLTAFGVVLTLGVFIYVALGILDAWQGVHATSRELFETIERETPYLR